MSLVGMNEDVRERLDRNQSAPNVKAFLTDVWSVFERHQFMLGSGTDGACCVVELDEDPEDVEMWVKSAVTQHAS